MQFSFTDGQNQNGGVVIYKIDVVCNKLFDWLIFTEEVTLNRID